MDQIRLGRLETEENGDLFTITIPSNKDCNQMLIIIALLGFWFLVEMYFFGTLMGGKALLLLAVLLLWTGYGGLLILALLWKLGGREVIILAPDSLKLELRLFEKTFSREYLPDEVKGFRKTNLAKNSSLLRLGEFIGYGGKAFQFIYKNKIVRFGTSISFIEMAFIFEKFKERGYVRVEI
jgi:hypothetical protein